MLYLRWDCAQTSVKNSRIHAQKPPHVLHIVWLTDRELRLALTFGVNDIVFDGFRGEKYSGVPAESFCKCEPERMNIALVLCGRRDGAQAAALKKRRKKKIKENLKVLTGIIRIWHEQNRWYEYIWHKMRLWNNACQSNCRVYQQSGKLVSPITVREWSVSHEMKWIILY